MASTRPKPANVTEYRIRFVSREGHDLHVHRFAILALITVSSSLSSAQTTTTPTLTEVRIPSTLDGKPQPITWWAPSAAKQTATPLFVFLHSWSSDYTQDNRKWLNIAVRNNWIYIHPNFRGKNSSPQACGSRFARQDILDAVDFASRQFEVDSTKIYLAGVSGGGHMAMLMAGHHPDRFSAVSAWVGISDLPEWYQFHTKDGTPSRYAKMILQCFHQPPGTDATADAEYRDRSPVFHMHRADRLPVDIFAGVNDGHTGSVPVSHSLRAFNAIAGAHGNRPVTDDEMRQLWEFKKLTAPLPEDQETDETLGRKILLRRTSGPSRVTIFDGGHESIPAAAEQWLKLHTRQTEAKAAEPMH